MCISANRWSLSLQLRNVASPFGDLFCTTRHSSLTFNRWWAYFPSAYHSSENFYWTGSREFGSFLEANDEALRGRYSSRATKNGHSFAFFGMLKTKVVNKMCFLSRLYFTLFAIFDLNWKYNRENLLEFFCWLLRKWVILKMYTTPRLLYTKKVEHTQVTRPDIISRRRNFNV